MFAFNKGTIKLRDIDAIEILSEKNESGIILFLQAKLKNGKTRIVGGIRLFDEEKPHPQRYLVSLQLPSDKSWKDAFTKLRPNELTIKLAVGAEPVSATATWKLKKE